MPTVNEACFRHQQSRWLRPDAMRWVRPDAARFLKPGTRLEDVFPALALKYNPNQPRVPAGSGEEGGRWTDDNGGGSSLSRPMGRTRIDAGDFETGDLFGIGPERVESDGQRLAANDPPGLPFDLAEEEQNGGHGISEHVGKSERFLKDSVRLGAAAILARGEFFDGLAKGSFTSLQSANRVVNSTISQNQDTIARMISADDPHAVLNSRFASPTWYEAYLDRAYAEPYMRETYRVRVIILRDRGSLRGWRIQSAFPLR